MPAVDTPGEADSGPWQLPLFHSWWDLRSACSEEEVEFLLSFVDPNKATGPDGIISKNAEVNSR